MDHLSSTYNPVLVVVSIAIAVLAAYTALTMSHQIATSHRWKQIGWLLGGAVSMGIGIWSMHFVGMLAFCLPISVTYDGTIVLLSLVVAILTSGIALFLVSRRQLGILHWLGGSLLMGCGIATMHYLGMVSMQLPALANYNGWLVALSVGIAIAISAVALWLTLQIQELQPGFRQSWQKIGSATLMGVAISAMHYTGMTTVRFYPLASETPFSLASIDSSVLAILVSIFAFSVLGIALLVTLEAQVSRRTAALVAANENLQQQMMQLQLVEADLKQVQATLRERAEQLRSHNHVLIELSKHYAIRQGDLLAAVQAAIAATARTIKADRVSIWLYDEDRLRLSCASLFEQNSGYYQQGMSLAMTDFPAYFQSLDGEDLIAAHDAHIDPRTCEFSQVYLQPLNICSMLDVPIRLMAETVGVLCIEQVGEKRQWMPEDESFARAIGDLVSLAIEARNRQLAEIQIRQQAKDLEDALDELQRTQTQIIQAEKMSSLGQMVAGIAHEINNPINFVHGNLNHVHQYAHDLLSLLSLYQQTYPDPPQVIQDEIGAIDLTFLAEDLFKILQSMRLGTDRIRQIVLSLRNFSRLDEADLKDVDIHEGIDSTLVILGNRLKACAKRPEIQVIKNYEHLPKVECYAGQLNQVFMNILSNAIDALEESNTQRTFEEIQAAPNQIRICTSVLDSHWVQIAIADNGLGIPAHLQKRLFDPFFTTKPVGKGTGLGLSISYQITTEKHGGKLHCFSSPGKGSEFIIELPVSQ